MSAANDRCVRCGKARKTRPRSLCSGCYADPAVREMLGIKTAPPRPRALKARDDDGDDDEADPESSTTFADLEPRELTHMESLRIKWFGGLYV